MSIRTMTRVWDHAPYNGGSLLTLLALADYADDNGICWPDQSSIARKARLTDRQVRNVLAGMVADGELLMHTRRGRGGRSCYQILTGLSEDERAEKRKSFPEMVSAFLENRKSAQRKPEIHDSKNRKSGALFNQGLQRPDASNPSPNRHIDPSYRSKENVSDVRNSETADDSRVALNALAPFPELARETVTDEALIDERAPEAEAVADGLHPTSPVAPPPHSAPPPSPARPARERKPKAEPQSPPDVREALAEICGIDLRLAPKGNIIEVNKAAADFWAAHQETAAKANATPTPAGLVKRLTFTAAHCRKCAWECQERDGKPARLPTIAVLRKYYGAAMAEYAKVHRVAQPAAASEDENARYDPERVRRDAELARQERAAHQQRLRDQSARLALQGNAVAIASLTRVGRWPLPPEEAQRLGGAA